LFAVRVRAVVLPATPLLVAGAGGAAPPPAGLRELVVGALSALLDDVMLDGAPLDAGRRPGPLAVLAHRSGPTARSGAARPSLAGAGVPAAWVPALAAWEASGDDVAQVPASVALLCLTDALEARGERARLRDVVVHEVPPGLAGLPDELDAVVAEVRGARGVVVAGGGVPGGLDTAPDALAPGVRAVLGRVAASWSPEVRRVAVAGDHLPPEYRVTLLRG
jgi:hypothetical protein